MKTANCCIVLGLIWCIHVRPCLGDWRVWTVTETRWVMRDEQPGSAGAKPDRSPAVRLAAAKNEVASFQVLVRSDQPVRGVTVEAGDLKGPDGSALPAAAAEMYRQHQIELTEGTYRNKEFKPGWYPDPLIPFRHPVTGQPLKGARFTAAPFDLPADQTHGFWVDVAVPAGARAGEYRGTYRVAAEAGRVVEVPVTLTVWDFELPRVSTLQTAFGSPAGRMRSYYAQRAKAGKEPAPTDWQGVEAQCAELLSRHRFSATPPAAGSPAPVAQPDGSFRIPPEQVRAFREFADRYHVNALQVPHPGGVVKDPAAERAKLHAWLKAWDQAAKELDRPGITFYTYLKDEPNDQEAYQYVQKWGKAIREANSVVKVLVVEQTKTQDDKWGDLYGAVDIWCPLFCLHDPATAERRQAAGETVWTYTALCQQAPTPWWHIDYPLLNYRVPAWMAWRYRIRGLLYWGGMSYWSQVEDPWTDGWTYGRQPGKKGLVYNGEGTIIYPARPAGYDGIVPSLRLKALRDSIEDYEYLAILERLGLADQAQQVVLSVTKSFFEWDRDPAAWEQARAKLAQLILAARR